MNVTTIACPVAMTHPEINPESAPIWTDAEGNEYRVASGVIEDCKATRHKLAKPDKITIMIDLPGLEALAAMGLSVKEVEV
jgi:hypothetical protein